MKKSLGSIITSIIIIILIALGFALSSYNFGEVQIKTIITLSIVCGCSILYCFIVGEITRNNSQMDKLWSILPIIYTWIIAGYSGFNVRNVLFAIVVSLWGIRLTSNFARKGAYKLKFWEGEEDYRWQVLRKNKYLSNKFAWGAFDLLFISLYQNVLVLLICLPSFVTMTSGAPLGTFDYLAIGFALLFLMIETIADEQQMAFHTTKRKMLNEGKSLEDLPDPYNLGFNTTGLWKYLRHPNYLGEQGIWISLYFVVLGAQVANYGIFNWTIIGPLLLIFLFMGSSSFSEGVSAGKYKEYKNYQDQVYKYLPFHKFKY